MLAAKLGEQLGKQLGEQVGEQLRPIVAALQRRDDAVSISGMDSARWQQLEAAFGLVTSLSRPPTGVSPRSIFAFKWDERNETAQSDRYMPHLKQSFLLGTDRQRTLTWIAGDVSRDLLSVSTPAAALPFSLNGTCDAAVVTTEAYKTNLYNRGLLLVFELKKGTVKFGHKEMHQASTQLLLANILSPATKPVVVLTDLDQQWRILHFDGSTLCPLSLDGERDVAVGIIDKILASYCAGGDDAAVSSQPLEEVGEVNDRIFKRRRLFEPSSGLALSGDVGNLADLASFLPEKEYMETRQAEILSLFLRTPGIAEGLRGTAFWDQLGIGAAAGGAGVVGSAPPPAGMYI